MKARRLDLTKLKVYPLAERKSLVSIDDILVNPESAPPEAPEAVTDAVAICAERIRQARAKGATVMLIYGAHLVRNGAGLIVERLLREGWITHLATNGAGVIHDWEFAHQGRSTEKVETGVADGNFGAWEETGRAFALALLSGSLREDGFGGSLGRFIHEDGAELPNMADLAASIQLAPAAPLTPARAMVLGTMRQFRLHSGKHEMLHPWKHSSFAANAWLYETPLTVHPGIGYDIIACHPLFNGPAIGRAAAWDFAEFCGSVEKLDGGVVLSVGSAIMGPQIFEKSLSCVHNLRFQAGRERVSGHSIFVVDLQDGGGWDWTRSEPPKDHPAYYLRFCKSYSRMGGEMRYVQCDNRAFVHHLWRSLAG